MDLKERARQKRKGVEDTMGRLVTVQQRLNDGVGAGHPAPAPAPPPGSGSKPLSGSTNGSTTTLAGPTIRFGATSNRVEAAGPPPAPSGGQPASATARLVGAYTLATTTATSSQQTPAAFSFTASHYRPQVPTVLQPPPP
jgi:hypothetical protein